MRPILDGILGLLVFLMGMKIMSRSLSVLGSSKVKTFLASLTHHSFRGFLTGALATAVLQSSSLTTVLVVGLVHAKLITLRGAIPIILGANVGTTVTAHLLSFTLEKYSFLFIIFALLLYMVSKRGKYFSLVVLGFGILLTGMKIMTQGLSTLKDSGLLEMALHIAEGSPVGGILAGAFASALTQSSSAVIAFVIALAKENSVALSTCMLLVFGADIGTCVTSALASSSTNLAGRRAALAHLLFNCLSAVVVLLIIPYFLEIVRLTSSSLPRQIANGHTLYNVLGGLLFLPFVNCFAKLIATLIPDK